MQLALIVVALLIGIVFGIVATLQWNWLAGLAMLGCGIYVAVAIFLREWNLLENQILPAISGIILIISLAAVVVFNKAFDQDYQSANTEVFTAFINMDTLSCSITPELTALKEKGRSVCSTENYFEISDALGQFAKALYLSPPASLVDGVSSSLTHQNKPQSCGEIFKKAYSLCPNAFISVSEISRNKLLAENTQKNSN